MTRHMDLNWRVDSSESISGRLPPNFSFGPNAMTNQRAHYCVTWKRESKVCRALTGATWKTSIGQCTPPCTGPLADGEMAASLSDRAPSGTTSGWNWNRIAPGKCPCENRRDYLLQSSDSARGFTTPLLHQHSPGLLITLLRPWSSRR